MKSSLSLILIILATFATADSPGRHNSGAARGPHSCAGTHEPDGNRKPGDDGSSLVNIALVGDQTTVPQPKSPLICNFCYNIDGFTCTSNRTETCKENVTNCITMVHVRGKGRNKVHVKIYKGCERVASWRDTNFNITFGEDQYYYSTAQTCQTNNCNKGPVQMPPIDITENGKQCPQCYAPGVGCTPEIRKCVGQQTRCVKFIGAIFTGIHCENYTIQGCTHEHLVHQTLPVYPGTMVQPGFKLEFLKDQ